MVKPLRFGIIGTGVGATFIAQAMSMIADGETAKLMSVTSVTPMGT